MDRFGARVEESVDVLKRNNVFVRHMRGVFCRAAQAPWEGFGNMYPNVSIVHGLLVQVVHCLGKLLWEPTLVSSHVLLQTWDHGLWLYIVLTGHLCGGRIVRRPVPQPRMAVVE